MPAYVLPGVVEIQIKSQIKKSYRMSIARRGSKLDYGNCAADLHEYDWKLKVISESKGLMTEPMIVKHE